MLIPWEVVVCVVLLTDVILSRNQSASVHKTIHTALTPLLVNSSLVTSFYLSLFRTSSHYVVWLFLNLLCSADWSPTCSDPPALGAGITDYVITPRSSQFVLLADNAYI